MAPFVATRYADPERLAAYTAPAYDLIEPAERARLTSADPRSIVHLTLPTFGAEDAAARLAAWREDGTLAVEHRSALYVYELAGPGPERATRGWVGAVAFAPPPVVAPHEATVAAVVADRRALRDATHADLEPVVLAHNGAQGPAAALARRIVAERVPDADLTDDAGVRHRLWRVADPTEIAAVRADLATRHAVIADGHHRWTAAFGSRGLPTAPDPAARGPAAVHDPDLVGSATGAASPAAGTADPARAAQAAVAADAAASHGVADRAAGPSASDGVADAADCAAVDAADCAAVDAADCAAVDAAGAPAAHGAAEAAEPVAGAAASHSAAAHRVLALIVPAGEHGPQVRAIHRVLPDTPLDQIDVRHFRCDPVGPLRAAVAADLLAEATESLVLLTDGDRWLRLTEPDPDTAGVPAAWRGLDVALVDVLLVAKRPTVVLRHTVAAAVDEARRARGVALLVRPTATATVLEVAARGVLMPRKSTFFVPKPRTGLVMRCFVDQPSA